MTSQAQTALDQMSAKISQVAGVPVEITIRSEKAFTFSTETRNEEAAARLVNFFEGQAAVSVEHDDEVGSFVYVTLN